jgi:hypothetical protein
LSLVPCSTCASFYPTHSFTSRPPFMQSVNTQGCSCSIFCPTPYSSCTGHTNQP